MISVMEVGSKVASGSRRERDHAEEREGAHEEICMSLCLGWHVPVSTGGTPHPLRCLSFFLKQEGASEVRAEERLNHECAFGDKLAGRWTSVGCERESVRKC